MKKYFEIIGILTLLIFSFFATDKTINVVKEEDEIMIRIKQEYKKYNKKGENAIILKNSIIPGISSRKVNINKSYQNMREYGTYNDELYVYDYKKPKLSITNNKDKVITSGNKKYRQISLIILLNDDSKIDNLLQIINDNDLKINIFVTDNWLIHHSNLIVDLIAKGHCIGISSVMNYNSSEVKWMDTVIKKVGKQKDNYCLYKNKENCQSLNNYTIKPISIYNNYLMNIQDSISNGNMYVVDYTNSFKEELPSIIRYITSKGYNIVPLKDMIKE